MDGGWAISGSVTLTREDGFSTDHRYEVDLTRLVGGREEIYSTTILTLR